MTLIALSDCLFASLKVIVHFVGVVFDQVTKIVQKLIFLNAKSFFIRASFEALISFKQIFPLFIRLFER